MLREVYYLLYADDYEIPSKIVFDPMVPSLGRIRADSVAPPHSPTSIKLCISRVEGNPALASARHADLFADTSCDTPLKGGHISILPTDCPGLSPNNPMAIVLRSQLIPDGKYLIKNRATDIYWYAGIFINHMTAVYFYLTTMEVCKTYNEMQVNNRFPIIQMFKG